jgi:pimeloyl-ACP methyl ester carboxylesterase
MSIIGLSLFSLLFAAMNAPVPARTQFATSKDGTRIAFDVTGTGPAVMLLHGGGQNRHVWHDTGYVSRLSSEFTVVSVDMRGSGDSDKPANASAYAIDQLNDDLVAVANSAGIGRFTLWGFSYGANIGRYLAARSDRVRAMVYIGIPFGRAADGVFRKMILDLQAKWTPRIEAQHAGRLDTSSWPAEDRGAVPLNLAWLSAMLDYPPIEPADMRSPTLWVVGTKNDVAMASLQAYESKLAQTHVKVAVLEGLTHPQELEHIDQAFSHEVDFTRAHGK